MEDKEILMGETSPQHAMPAPHLLCTLCGLPMHIYVNGMTAPEHNAIVTSVTNHTDTWIQFREVKEGPEKQFPFQEWVRASWRVRNEPKESEPVDLNRRDLGTLCRLLFPSHKRKKKELLSSFYLGK